jgi:hypothetical protein
MEPSLDILSITRAGQDYTLHFANGTYAHFRAADIEPIISRAGLMPLVKSEVPLDPRPQGTQQKA